MTYSWTIISFETRDVVNDAAASLADAVVSVKWKRDGVDSGGATGSVLGYTVLAEYNTAIQAKINKQVATKKSPPWA